MNGEFINMPINRKSLEMIAKGEKKAEYRLCSSYWLSRIKPCTIWLKLINGYTTSAPYVVVNIKRIVKYIPNKCSKLFTLIGGIPIYENEAEYKRLCKSEWGFNCNLPTLVFELGEIVTSTAQPKEV